MPSSMSTQFQLRRGNGRLLKFGGDSSFAPASDSNDRWTPVFEYGLLVAHDIYNVATEATERYAIDGLIQKTTSRNGQITHFTYESFQGTHTGAIAQKVLLRVTDHFGRSIHFTYNNHGHLATMRTPADEVYTYAYDEPSGGSVLGGKLTSVTYPDQSKRIYWNNEPAHTDGQNRLFALTGITDENGVRLLPIHTARLAMPCLPSMRAACSNIPLEGRAAIESYRSAGGGILCNLRGKTRKLATDIEAAAGGCVRSS